MKSKETLHSRIWREVPEPDNPFAAATCFCHGYDVYGDILGKASWIEYLFLLFAGERPTELQRRLLEGIAVAIANPGPRDQSVLAAMNGGVGGSNNAACLIAALAVGAGQLGGAREVALAMAIWRDCGTRLDAWQHYIVNTRSSGPKDTWPEIDHVPGFDPHGASCTTPVRITLSQLSVIGRGKALAWLDTNRHLLEGIVDCPLALTGVVAAAFHDLGLTSDQGEMLYLILRLPGAAVHALEQNEFGYRKFPFFRDAVRLGDETGPGNPEPEDQ